MTKSACIESYIDDTSEFKLSETSTHPCISTEVLSELAEAHGTPLFVVNHQELRKNYALFRQYLPKVQAYYAIKANPDPAIIKTLFDLGSSFDVSSMEEFKLVHELIKDYSEEQKAHWIRDKIIYANPIKPPESLIALNSYRPLVTFDNHEEILKIKKYGPDSRLILRLRVSNAGAMVELSSKFGVEPAMAMELIMEAESHGLTVEGLSFHVGSQTTDLENYVKAVKLAGLLFKEAKEYGFKKMNILDIGGGFPAPYDESVKPFAELADFINRALDTYIPSDVHVIAEPGRFFVATTSIAVSKIIGKAVRHGKLCYYINDGVYHTFSGIIFDHCQYHLNAFKTGPNAICTVFGPTCDGLDVISKTEELPCDLECGDLLYSTNIGAYSGATATYFNGFPPAKIVHVNL